MHQLDEYLKKIKTLPPGPRILAELMRMLRRPDIDSAAVVELISFDPALTTQMLQRCNSALYGLTRPVYSIEEAVLRLGYNQIYRLVATVVGEHALSGPQSGYGLRQGELWEHSAATALAAKLLAGGDPASENLFFTAALLHDIGKLILSGYLEDNYEYIFDGTERCGLSLMEAEKMVLGIEHAELGGRILAQWNFPESIVCAVRHHHDPLQATPYQHLASAIYIADMVAHIAGHSFGYQAFAVRAESAPAQLLGLDDAGLQALVLETEETLSQSKLFARAA